MSAGFDRLRAERLQWLPDLGIGYYPVQGMPYDEAYWERYLRYDMSPTGNELTRQRIDLVARHWGGELVDVGIGGGRFVRKRPNTRGYDINPAAEAWLEWNGLWKDPYVDPVPAVSCWDSFEHIPDPAPLLRQVSAYVFMSLPIFEGPEHVMRSKHFRKDEHFWYFTEPGLVTFMAGHGFEMIESNTMEQGCGREDIGTYVFQRVAACS